MLSLRRHSSYLTGVIWLVRDVVGVGWGGDGGGMLRQSHALTERAFVRGGHVTAGDRRQAVRREQSAILTRGDQCNRWVIQTSTKRLTDRATTNENNTTVSPIDGWMDGWTDGRGMSSRVRGTEDDLELAKLVCAYSFISIVPHSAAT